MLTTFPFGNTFSTTITDDYDIYNNRKKNINIIKWDKYIKTQDNYLYNEIIYSATTSGSPNYWETTSGSLNLGTTETPKWDDYLYLPPPSPREQLRRAMAQRLAPAIHVLRKALTPAEEQETRARGTLRRVVGDEKFQRYLCCGFVTVRNPRNGLTYQCFPGHGGVKVWKDGKMVESWCVFLQGNFPPTDQLITRYLMVLNNPDQLRAIANVSQGRNPMHQPQQALPQEDLVQLFKKLKAA
jgi:hypothetical protein